jgi:hypothetical protein
MSRLEATAVIDIGRTITMPRLWTLFPTHSSPHSNTVLLEPTLMRTHTLASPTRSFSLTPFSATGTYPACTIPTTMIRMLIFTADNLPFLTPTTVFGK